MVLACGCHRQSLELLKGPSLQGRLPCPQGEPSWGGLEEPWPIMYPPTAASDKPLKSPIASAIASSASPEPK